MCGPIDDSVEIAINVSLIMKYIFSVILLLVSTVSAADRLILCGWDEVFMIDPVAEKPAKTWSWKAKDHPEIPTEISTAFRTTDDCKPVDDGKRLVVSSSSGGCAVLEMPSGKVVWSAKIRNAHSIESMPGGRILVASSVGGDKLLLFDEKLGDKILWSTPLPSAHGLVWDAGRKRL
jgi:hypothetical protein